MTQLLRVGIAEWRMGHAPDVLICYGLGSCVGIALYDPLRRCGGVAHALLPDPVGSQALERPGKFVPTAIDQLITALQQGGADIARLQAKLCGGASMFRNFGSDGTDSIGRRNLAAALATLGPLGIPVVASDVGENFGRTMELDLATGLVHVRTVRGHVKLKQL